MGDFFVMSTRFDKSSATDFNFISINTDLAVNPKDGAIWMRCALYDFGWGKENGYFRVPLPDFKLLLHLALYSTSREDAYGAAAVIIEKYAEDLLIQTEKIMINPSCRNDFLRLIRLFNLDYPINRSSIMNKSNAQIENDFLRWKAVSKSAKLALSSADARINSLM